MSRTSVGAILFFSLQLNCTQTEGPVIPEIAAVETTPRETAVRIDAASLARITARHGLPQSPPTFSVDATPQDLRRAEAIVSGSAIEFSYINGGCHGRAHALTSLLADQGVVSFKVWAFAPGKYSIVRDDLIEIESGIPGARGERISWGYHVAVGIYTDQGERILDPAFSNHGMTRDFWLTTFDCKECYIIETDPRWYLFNTLDGYRITDNITIPSNYPSIWTGGFWECEGDPCPFMVHELAMNDAAAYLIRRLETTPTGEAAVEIRTMLMSVSEFEATLRGEADPMQSEIRGSKQFYVNRLDYWTERMR
jgi:hypothetical protein